MGKASRRSRRFESRPVRPAPVPFVARPFEGLAQEAEWVALREILPAASVTVTLAKDYAVEGVTQSRIATVLPMAWPGLHRADGVVFAATQSGNASGDASRDLAAQLLAAAALEPGTPLTMAPQVTGDSPRLQDILDLSAPLEFTVHEGFDFWVEGQDLGPEEQDSLDRANESAAPTVRYDALPSTFWVSLGDRSFIRQVLSDDEDAATTALARLHASGESSLGGSSKLLGAFRASGLLVPVWEVPTDTEAGEHESALVAFGERYAAALTATEPLTADERRARAGLLSRQVTLR